MFMYESKIDNVKVAVGTVVEAPRFFEKDGVKRAEVKIKDWRNEILSIFFNNKAGGAPAKQLADRIEKVHLKEGSYIACLCLKAPDQKSATGIGFQFSGIFTDLVEYKEDGTESIVTVIVGLGCNPKKVKDGMYSISIPVKNKDGATDWYSISFYDNEKAKNAETAEKLFKGEKRTCAVRCGAIKTKEVDGRVFNNLTGYRIEVAPSAPKEA